MIAEGPNAYYRLRYHLYLIIPTFFREDLNIRDPSESAHVFKKKLCNKRFLSDISLSPFNAPFNRYGRKYTNKKKPT